MDRNHGLRRRAEQQLWCRRGLFAALAVAVVGVWYACLPAVMKLIVVHRDHIEVWARALIALGELPDAAKLPPVRVPGLGVEGHLLVPIQAGLLRVASTETALVGLFGVVYLAAFAICLGDPRARGGRLWLLAAMIDPPIWYIALGGWYPGLAMPLLLLALWLTATGTVSLRGLLALGALSALAVGLHFAMLPWVVAIGVATLIRIIQTSVGYRRGLRLLAFGLPVVVVLWPWVVATRYLLGRVDRRAAGMFSLEHAGEHVRLVAAYLIDAAQAWYAVAAPAWLLGGMVVVLLVALLQCAVSSLRSGRRRDLWIGGVIGVVLYFGLFALRADHHHILHVGPARLLGFVLLAAATAGVAHRRTGRLGRGTVWPVLAAIYLTGGITATFAVADQAARKPGRAPIPAGWVNQLTAAQMPEPVRWLPNAALREQAGAWLDAQGLDQAARLQRIHGAAAVMFAETSWFFLRDRSAADPISTVSRDRDASTGPARASGDYYWWEWADEAPMLPGTPYAKLDGIEIYRYPAVSTAIDPVTAVAVVAFASRDRLHSPVQFPWLHRVGGAPRCKARQCTVVQDTRLFDLQAYTLPVTGVTPNARRASGPDCARVRRYPGWFTVLRRCTYKLGQGERPTLVRFARASASGDVVPPYAGVLTVPRP